MTRPYPDTVERACERLDLSDIAPVEVTYDEGKDLFNRWLAGMTEEHKRKLLFREEEPC